MVIYAPDGTPVISVKVDDSSYLFEEIMGDASVILEFALTDHVELEPGSYVLLRGAKYELLNRADVSIQHTRDYQYKATFSGPQARFGRYIVYNALDGRVQFDMIGKPKDHLDLILGNLQLREPGVWTYGDYVDKPEGLVSYSNMSIKDALTAIADAFDTEWSVEALNGGYAINLCKQEFNKSDPLALGYGKNQGFKPGVGRINFGEFGQVERVWIVGGERNLSVGAYGYTTLHFPKSLTFNCDKNGKLQYTINGTTYTEDGFDSASALGFVTDEWGASVKLASAASNCNEAPLDLSQYYPKREGTVSGVYYLFKGQYFDSYSALTTAFPNLTEDDWLNVQVDIVDASIPANLNYAECCLSADEPMTVIFQTGELMGREFSAAFVKAPITRVVDGQTVTVKPGNRFELVRTTIDGVDMPNATFRPNAGAEADKYIVVNVYMPEQYICNYAGFEGAEIEALKEACKFIFDNKDPQFSFKGQVDDLFVKRNRDAVSPKLKLGGCISFQDSQIQPTPIVTRIVGIKTYINSPDCPELTLSNETVKGGMASLLAQLRAEDEHVIQRVKEARRFSQRSFRDAKETISMLAGALDYFSEGINPITVETMSLLVGDQSLQFKFYTTRACTTPVVNPVTYDPDTHKVSIPACVIQHFTLGITDIKPSDSRSVDEYLRWSMVEYESDPLTGTDELGHDRSEQAYYIYAKVDAENVAKPDSQRTEEELTHIVGEFLVTTQKHALGPASGSSGSYYYLLVGILNSEYEGGRSFAPMYGFTEVLPGQITTDVIRSASGDSYFDLEHNQFALGDSLTFLNNVLSLKGAVVVTGAGETTALGAWCGQWTVGTQYAAGDEVWWRDPNTGAISSYRYIYPNPSYASSSNDPSHTNYWEVYAQGAVGGQGAHGINTAVVYLYKRAASAPTIDWSNALTYSFETNALTSEAPSGWYKRIADVPASDYPLYVTAATAASDTNTDTIAANEWASPVILAENGTDGLNTATVMLYKRASSTPTGTNAKPTGAARYTFATGVLSALSGTDMKGWTQAIPSGSNPCYVIQVTAIATGDYDDIANTEWSSPVKLVENGTEGNGISSIVERWAAPTVDGNTHPADSNFTLTSRPNPEAGKFTWRRTTISYTDPNTADQKFYDATYCAANGTPGPATPYMGEYDKNEKGEYDLDGQGNIIHQTYYGTPQRCDIVYFPQTGMWYMAQQSVGGTFSNQPPATQVGDQWVTNTQYWGAFSTNYRNVATGLLFAVESVIEKAIVRLLKTANEGNARIVARDDALSMFDSGDNEKLRIHGGSLSETRTSDDYDFYQTWYAISYNEILVGTVDYTETRLLLSSQGFQFNCYEGAVLNIPAIVMNVEMFLNPTPSGSYQGGGFIRFGWKLDGVEISEEDVNVWFGSSIDPVTMPARQVALSAGQHELRLWGRFQGGASPIPSNTELRCYVYTTGNRRISVTYADQITEVASNGFQVRFGSNQMLRCIKTTSDIELMMQANNYGIRISSSYLHLRINGTWYNCTRDSSGYLKLNLI